MYTGILSARATQSIETINIANHDIILYERDEDSRNVVWFKYVGWESAHPNISNFLR